MCKIQASEAHLPQLRDDVERDGTPIIAPEGDRQEEIDEAIASIKQLHKRTGRISFEDLRSARDEGRRY